MWPNSCNFAELIFAGRLIFFSFAELIFVAGEKIQYFYVIFVGFWAYISLLQIFAICLFENMQFRGINFRGYLDFVRFRGINKIAKISSAKIRSAKIYAREN